MTKWKIDWGAVAVLALLGVLMMGPLLAPQDPELVDLAKRKPGTTARCSSTTSSPPTPWTSL